MCRVEERVYIGADGSRQTFEDTFPCDRAHRGRLCSKVKRRTTEYFPKPPPAISRDDASSPASNNPPTPTGTGSYLVEQRQPSGAARPSTRDGSVRAIKPEIVIEFGSKKGGSKKYPSVSVTSKSYKRSSLGASSVASNDVAVESPGSDASYTIRTGFPEAPVAPAANPFGQSQGYNTRPAVPQGHRHTSSTSSYTTSSQPPSLYATSDPDSPSGRRPARYPPTIVHNPLPGGAPSSPTASRASAPAPAPSSPYRTTTVVPQSSSRDNVGPDGLTPLDYSDFVDHSASSRASSGRAAAPEITDRAADRERRRKQKEDGKKRQEEADRRLAEEVQKQEEVKQVRFELGRAEGRAHQRGENLLAEIEKRKWEDREETRRKKEQESKAAKEKAAKEKAAKESKREREKTKPPTRDFNKRPGGHSRRPSMTQADIDERNRLLAETEKQMALERQETERREREEQAEALRQRQQTNEYWDPRGGDRLPIANTAPGLGRRGSVSARRPSITGAAPVGLGRRDSTRRVSIIQNTPPPLTTSFPTQQYSTRPPSSHHNQASALFSPGGTSTTYSSRPPSARHSSYHDNPFAAPPTRGPNSVQHVNQDNPFAPALQSPPVAAPRDPWDSRDLREALPRANGHRDQHHRGAQQATQTMGKAFGYEDDYESPSEDERYGGRHGLSKGGKRRHN